MLDPARYDCKIFEQFDQKFSVPVISKRTNSKANLGCTNKQMKVN